MQAIKPHSPSIKKPQTATLNANNSNKSDQTNNIVKSVAQRVMEVANNNNNGPTSSSTGILMPTTTSSQQQMKIQQSSSISNGSNNDQDVEDMTTILVANLDLAGATSSSSPSAGQQQVSISRSVDSDQNSNINGTLTVTVQKSSRTDSKSPSLLLDSPTTQHSPMNIHQPRELVGSDSVFRQIVAKSSKTQAQEQMAERTIETKRNQQQQQQQQQHFRESVSSRGTTGDLSGGSSISIEKDNGVAISLDSKVPLPSKANTICDGEYHEANMEEEEEVSYYNDQVTAAKSLQRYQQQQDFQRQQQNGSSLGSCNSINNNINSNGIRGIPATNKTRAQKSLAAKQGQKLSVIVPTTVHTSSNCSSQQKQHHHPLINTSSREYLNELDEDDDYESRYDNAMVEEKTAFGYEQQNVESLTPTSPKAKSAPATPCNVTPTAFHQNTSHLNSMLNGPSQANTLPPDIRMTISNTSRVLPSSLSSSSHKQLLESHLEELKQCGDSANEKKDYVLALRLYTQCIDLARNNQNTQYLRNSKVYSQRAEAHFYLQNYNEAIEDSITARELNPKCTQAYYRQGRAQFLNGQHADSLAVFSFGLAQDPSSKRLFDALVDAALRSNFKGEFELKYNKLKSLDLEKNPFVVVSVLGQELLARGHGQHAAVILESALKLGADNKSFKASVLSTISFAYCLLKDYAKAISYMQKELDIETELEDVSGQCRVLSNMGYTYYKIRKFDKSLESHRKQMSLAMRTQLYQQASQALNAIGHVHAVRNDFTSALTSHTRCLEILKQLGDNDYNQFRELLSIGHIHSMLGDYKSAEEKYNEGIQLLDSSSRIKKEDCQIGRVMVSFNFAYLALKKQSFLEAKHYYETVIKLSNRLPETHPKRILFEMRASNGMGQMYRLFKKFEEAKLWFKKQLQLAEQSNDTVGRSQALCNLGMTYQHFEEYTMAWNMFDENLRLVEDKDPLLKAYAHSYMASMHFLLQRYRDAQAHYESSLNIFKELGYCSAEKKTIDLNMAALYERMPPPEINMSNSLTQPRKVMNMNHQANMT